MKPAPTDSRCGCGSNPRVKLLSLIPVLILYDADKVSENNQRLIKWIIDSSSVACKIIMTCQDESGLLDSIKSRCKLITISAPDTHKVISQQYILVFSPIT
jgi:DNA polymerase III delta prime subunit